MPLLLNDLLALLNKHVDLGLNSKNISKQ